MKLRDLGAGRRGLTRLAAILATTTMLAGCSSGASRFNESIFTDGILTGSTSNQRAIIGNAPAQPYPGDMQARAAPMGSDTTYASSGRGAVTPAISGVERNSLPPAGMAPQSAATATIRPAAGSTHAGAAAPNTMAAAAEAGWTRTGGTVVAVRPGETVYNLSKRFGVPESDILRANNLSASSQLAAGQQVIIPAGAGSGQAMAPAMDAAPRVADARASRDGVPAAPGRVPVPNSAPTQQVAILPQVPKPKEQPAPGQAPGTVAAATSAGAAPQPAMPAVAQAPADTSNMYTVVSGDSLYAVAKKTGVSTAELKAANGLSDGVLRIGQKLTIPASGGAVVARANPAVDPAATGSNAPVKAKAAEPSPVTAYTPPTRDETVIEEAVTQTAAIAPEATGIGRMRWPVRGRVIETYGRSSAGRTNDGIDIAVPEGTPVKAAENGVVIYAGDGLKEFGNTVLVRHEDGLVTVYGHASELKVTRGEKVRRGQEIARSGMSGAADLPKLHFEVRKDSTPVDPTGFLE